MENATPQISPPGPGDRIPDLLLATRDGTMVSLYDNARGRPMLIVFAAEAGDAAAALAELPSANAAQAVDIFVVSASEGNARPAANEMARAAIQVLCDNQRQAPRAFGFDWNAIGKQLLVFLLDENQRLLARFSAEFGSARDACLKHLESLEPQIEAERPRRIAPVLMIPRVFEPQFCRDLIDAFHVRGHEESGVYSLEGGEPRHAVDHNMKKRFDHYVRDDDLTGEISRRMARRVLPEIEKAFCYRVTKLEEFKIACYRASEKGYFRAHRDNFSPQTVHRRFAMTLNLNADDYVGGELRFPEYGPHLYKPATGEAIIFSCSMLHEALDVTEGERYVLLAFMYGEDGARQKAEMSRRMGQAGGA